jgi:exosortase D (VPLPA-CTERM-specific)
MERIWSTKEEYGYAYMIPIITAYFIWQKRYDILQEKFVISAIGVVFFIISLLILFLGILSATFSIWQYGFLLSVISSFFMLMGWRAFRKIIAPLFMLLLIVPLPAFLFNSLSGYLQLVSSQLGVGVIRLFGVSVYLEGNVIDLGIFKLQVVEACSGLRYLFPLFSLALIAAYIFRAAPWKRVIVVLSSIPITVFMNSFRIGVIGVLVEYGGIEQAEGFLHDFEGWIVFMACTGLLVLEMWILLKIGSTKLTLAEAFALDDPGKNNDYLMTNQNALGARHIALAIIAAVLITLAGSINDKNEIIPERESFTSFPLVLDHWDGRRDTITPTILEALKLTDYFIADYLNGNGKAVNYYVAYYASQKSGEAAHSPRSCIPGGGWKISDLKTVSVKDIEMAGEPLFSNRLLIKKGDNGQLVYYWFQQRDRIITNEYLVKWYLFWDSLTKNRTDGALVRLTTVVNPGEDIRLADERIIDFIKQVAPLMDTYVPR